MTDSILLEADGIVNGPRRESYGHPLDNLDLTAKLWAPILGVPVTAEQVALCMIQVKVARQRHAQKRDNQVDIAGYAQVLQMVIEERERRMTQAET